MEEKKNPLFSGWSVAAAGLIVGMLDTYIIKSLGINMALNGHDVTTFVGAYFTISFVIGGYIIGHLLAARKKLRVAKERIQQQMTDLEESRKKALQNEQLAAVGRMAAGVAHEVRNPLGVIRSSAGLIWEDQAVSDENRKAARFISEEVDRLNNFVTRLLDFTKPIHPRLETIDLTQTAQTAINLLADKVREKNLQVRIRNNDVSPNVAVDEDLLGRALLGLLVNAAQASEPGGEIEIRFGNTQEDMLVEVADAGPGVPEDWSEDILKPFVTTKPQGTGLGLPMAARIAQAHGGDLEVRSGAGLGVDATGACFRIRLPLQMMEVAS